MDLLYLNHLAVNKRPGGDRLLVLRWFDLDGHLQEASCATDLNLGHIMAAFSACLKRINAIETSQPEPVTTSYGGSIDLSSWTIAELMVAPFRWHLTMTSTQFTYEANLDANLEHVILAFAGALKFFCFKHGLSTLDSEVVRQRDRAGELGLLTKEDFHGHQ